MDHVLLGAIWYVVLLFSLTFHEAAHAWAAKRGGDLTAYLGGQVSLDPMPHIRREPFGTILMPLLSFALWGWMMGWASTPYDPRWADAHPKRAAWMSLAGPAANLLLVIAAGVCIRIGVMTGAFDAPQSLDFARIVSATSEGFAATLATLLSITFTLNVLLFVFNLIPVPPLDGSGAIGLLLSDDAARRFHHALRNPQFSMIGILVAWVAIRPLFWPILLFAVRILYPEVTYG